MPHPAALHRWEDLPLDKITEMVSRKTIAGGRYSLSQAYLKKGALTPCHAHQAEQMVYVLQGALRATIGGDHVTVREGDVLVVPEHAPYQVEALDDTFMMVVNSQ